MAKRGSGQPKIGKAKASSPGRTQRKTLLGHAKKIASQPKLKRRAATSARLSGARW
jgi:hypothetical protein